VGERAREGAFGLAQRGSHHEVGDDRGRVVLQDGLGLRAGGDEFVVAGELEGLGLGGGEVALAAALGGRGLRGHVAGAAHGREGDEARGGDAARPAGEATPARKRLSDAAGAHRRIVLRASCSIGALQASAHEAHDVLDAGRGLQAVRERVGREGLDVLGDDVLAAAREGARLERREQQHERPRGEALQHVLGGSRGARDVDEALLHLRRDEDAGLDRGARPQDLRAGHARQRVADAGLDRARVGEHLELGAADRCAASAP
jgi:hypothetical protein